MSLKSAAFGQLACLAFMLLLYFGASPAASARFGMYFAAVQVLGHGLVWWVAERRRG